MKGYSKTIQNGDFLWLIFNAQKNSFKINLSFGYILENQDLEYRYWHTSTNNGTYFQYSKLIKNRTNFADFIQEFINIDPIQQLEREDYHQKITMITNLTFYVYKQYLAPLGGFSCKCPLPKNVIKNKSIISFNRYNDNLCFYRCLAYDHIKVNHKRKTLLNKFTKDFQKKANVHFKNKPPIINMENMYKYEYLFKINIAIYRMDNNNGVYTVYNHKKFPGRSEIKLFACYCDNHFTGHLCYINNWKLFSKSYLCDICEIYFSSKSNLIKHQKNIQCSNTPRDVFRNIIFNYNATDVFHILERKYEVFFTEKNSHSYFACFDFESMLPKIHLTSGLTKNNEPVTTYVQNHIPISVSVFSNVPNFNNIPKFILSSGNVDELISEFIAFLNEISDTVYALTTLERLTTINHICNSLNIEENKLPPNIIKKINEIYRILPVFSFNGGNYDINIMKHHFFKHFTKPSVLKRGNNYLTIKTEKLKFLDISNYLQAGTSYDKFLKAFNASQTKAFFPYSWLDDLSKLNETRLPPKECFFNDLKNKPISDNDYSSCQKAWVRFKMKSMKDYLRFYNNLDTIPFVECISRMFELHKVRGVDIFRDAISLPGVSLYLLFSRCNDPYETSVSQGEHQLIKDAIVGGPSILFSRYSEINKTYIKSHIYEQPLKVMQISGYDANSLYLSTFENLFPSGIMSYRVLDPNSTYLKPIKRPKKYTRELQWLICMEKELGVPLITSLSPGGQQKVEQLYYVDGYYKNPDTGERILCEFLGCKFHGCKDCFGSNADQQKYYETHQKLQFFTNLPDVTLYVIWDHDFKDFMRDTFTEFNITRKEYLHSVIPKTLLYNKKISQKHLLKMIKQESIFGLVRCSVYIDENYYGYYDDFPPIFKIASVTRDHVTGHMKDHILKENLMSQPRTMLISTMYAENQPFITPQISWFLKRNILHNHEVFRIRDISEFIEFNPKKSFKTFMDDIISDRIAGDQDPNQKIQSVLAKNLGNAAYGKCCTRKDKLDKIYYANEENTLKYINTPFFKDLKCLSEDLYEVRTGHKKIQWNLPRQIGVFVYGYAKLRMLSFYYDFIHKFLLDNTYQLLYMDTDSLYCSFGYPTLDECVKPELKTEFENEKNKWLVSSPTDRTVGLFKREFSGSAFVGLNSKTYFCQGFTDGDNKLSCKGVKKTLNDLTLEVYKSVLDSTESIRTTNKGIKMYQDKMYTYEQVKDGLSYLYVKRKVLEDKIHTTTLVI